jgi:hypothetical protein
MALIARFSFVGERIFEAGPRRFLSTAADLHILAVNDLLRIDVVADNHSIERVHHFFPCHCAVVTPVQIRFVGL